MGRKGIPRSRPIEVEIDLAVAEIRRLATELGRAPRQVEHNAMRQGSMSINGLHIRGVKFSSLLKRAGIEKPKPAEKPRRGGGVPTQVEREIREAFQRGDHLPTVKQDWPLFAIPTRVERREIPQADGSVLVLTRYYASLR